MFAVSFPECRVFGTTFLVITEGAVSQQNKEEDNVGVRHQVLKSSRNSPEESQEQLRHVVEVSCNPPPARRQQDALALLPRLQNVLRADDFCRLSPDEALPVGFSDVLLLFVS